MISQDIFNADDNCYRLRALLRVIENMAREAVNTMDPSPHYQAISDIATLCEAGGDMLETVHEVVEGLVQIERKKVAEFEGASDVP